MSATRSPRTGVKAALAAAGAVGLMTTGAAFAATGHVPWVHQPSVGGARSTHAADPTHPTHPTGAPTNGAQPSGGPSTHAFGGLCRAYRAGMKSDHGKALGSPAFAALVAAAGGSDNVATFCAALPTNAPSGHPTHPSKPTQAASPTHPTHPTHPAKPTQVPSPTQPTHPSHPSRPTQAPTPTQPTPPSHPSKPTQAPTAVPSHSHPTR